MSVGNRDQWHAAGLMSRTREEMMNQDGKWGWPRPSRYLKDDPILSGLLEAVETRARYLNDKGLPCWLSIAAEEFGEVAREVDPRRRVEELIQDAAVRLLWAQAIEEQNAMTEKERLKC